MKKSILFTLLVCSIYVKSQSYTSSNYAISGDTIFLTKDSAVVSSNNYDTSGVGITWNFSNLKGKSQDNIRFKSATQTGFSALQWAYLFNSNNVNLASTDDDVIAVGSVQKTNPYQYYKISTTGLELRAESYSLSVMGKSYNIKNQYTTADVLYKFPLAINNKDSSTAGYTTTIPNIYYENVSIKRVNKVDASGTVITPFGTFSNCLRLISTVTETDTIAINGVGIPKVTYYYRELKWFVSTKKHPVLVVKQYLVNGKWKTDRVDFMEGQKFYQPDALFGYYPAAPSVGDTVQFQNLSTNASSYSWSFADAASGSNNTSTLINPTHIFNTAGTYSVRLIINNGSLKDTFDLPVSVNNGIKPIAGFTLNKNSLCAKDSVISTNSSSNASYNQWYFEGGLPTVSFDKTPKAVTYLTGGTFKVKLIVSNSNGMDSLIKYVTVTAIPSKPNKPIGESTLSQNPGNKNYTTNKVSGATKYTWSISPSNAGTTISTDTSATIVWSSTYTGAVKIKVLAENSCGQGKNSDSLMVTISPITSVENLQEIVAPKIYPNPSSGLIFIETFTPLNLEIYDLLGKLVFTSVLNNSSSLILNNGVYIIKTNSKGKIFTQKVIVSSNL